MPRRSPHCRDDAQPRSTGRVCHRKKSTKVRPIALRNRAKVLTEIAKSLEWVKINAVPDDEALRRPRDMMTTQ